MQATLNQQQPLGAEIHTSRTLDVEDYLAIVRRNLAWLLGPILGALTLAVVIAFFWPNTYESVAAIRVVPPAVPEKLVPTNVSVQMAERVQAMQQTILSRNTLTNIIQTYDLYRRERSRLPMEDIIEKMQRNIKVSGLTAIGNSNPGAARAAAFRIGFAYENRYVAQKVTRDLMTRFIDENIRERFSQSQQTTQFLRDQFDQKKLELDSIDQKLTAFRQANLGRLPDQMGSNLQQISVLESRVSTLNTNMSRARQEQMMLESDLRATREKLNSLSRIREVVQMPGGGSVAVSTGGASGPSETDIELGRVDRELQQLERGLERMLEQYKPTYPDVQRLQARISSLKKEREDLLGRKLALPSPGSSSVAQSPAPARTASVVAMNPQRAREVAEQEAQITRLQGQIRAKEMEAERYQREIGDAERRSREIQSRIEMGPVGATQLEQLMRDYELAKKSYDDLKTKLAQSQVASDLEERKQGETLEVLDLPSLPEQPTAPNRPVIVVAGVVLGMLLGLALVTMRELKDNSLKSLKDIRAYTQFNVLGSIPLIENDLVVRRQRRLSVLGWSTACLLSVLIMAGSIYYHFSTQV